MAARWSPAEDERLRRLHAEGLPVRAIAEDVGRSEDAVVARRRLLALPARRPRREWTAPVDALLRASADAGVPARAIAERLGLPLEAVRRRRRALSGPNRAAARYRPDEDDAIRALVAVGRPFTELSRSLGRSPDALRLRAQSLGLLSPAPRSRWSAEEDRLLRAGYANGLTCAAIAAHLASGRTAEGVAARARKLGLATYGRRWTAPEDDRLRALSASGAELELAARVLGRAPDAVRQRARRLGVAPPRGPARARGGLPWTEADDALLRSWLGAGPAMLARALGRSEEAVRRRRQALGLRHGRERSPHQTPPRRGGLTPGEAGVIARELDGAAGTRLLALARRLERTPGELRARRPAAGGRP